MKFSKFLSLLLAMLIAMTVFVGCDDPEDVPDDIEDVTATSSLTFEKVQGGYEVTGSTDKTLSQIIIPSTYKSKSVISIKERAFVGYENLSTVAIPSSITTIQNHAFDSCLSLNTIYIGYSLKSGTAEISGETSKLSSIGHQAFTYCGSLSGPLCIYFNGTMALFKSVKKGDGVSHLSSWIYQTDAPVTIMCLDGKLTYRWKDGENPTEEKYEQNEKEIYIPVKMEYKGDNATGVIELVLGSNNLPVKEIGKLNGKNQYTVEYTYNDKGLVIRTVETDITGALMTEDGQIISELIYDQNGNCIKSATVFRVENEEEKWTYNNTYDENNNIILSESETDSVRYCYDKNNNIIKEVQTIKSGNQTVAEQTIQYTYNQNGQLIKEQSNSTSSYIIPDYTIEYTYDSNGKKTQKIYSSPTHHPKQINYTYSYNQQGALTKVTVKKSEIPPHTISIITTIVFQGLLAGDLIIGDADVMQYTYDANGNLTKLIVEEDGKTFTLAFTYKKVVIPDGAEISTSSELDNLMSKFTAYMH